MRLPEVLETVASVYRANARTVLTVTALLTTPAYLASLLIARALIPIVERLAPADPLTPPSAVNTAMLGDLATALALAFAALALDQLTICLVAGALALAVGRPGEPARPVRAVLTALLPMLVRLVPVAAVVLLAIAGLVVAWIAVQVPVALTIGSPATTAGGPGAFLALLTGMAVVAAAVFVLVRWSLASPLLVLEGVGPLRALGRSWTLVRGSTWRVLGYAILIGLIAVILDITLVQSLAAIASVVAPSAVTAVEVGMGVLAQALLVPLAALTSLVLYHDLRSRPRVPMRGL